MDKHLIEFKKKMKIRATSIDCLSLTNAGRYTTVKRKLGKNQTTLDFHTIVNRLWLRRYFKILENIDITIDCTSAPIY